MRGGAAERAVALIAAVKAGNHRHAATFGQISRGAFVAHGGDGLDRGADENQPGRRTGTGKIGVLGQKAEAGMNGSDARAPRRVEDSGDV